MYPARLRGCGADVALPIVKPFSLLAATLCAAAVSAQCLAARATRDALFLTSLDLTVLPAMLVAAAVCSMLCLIWYGRACHAVAPARLTAGILAFSGTLFLAEWALRPSAPEAVGVLLYLHVTVSASLVASGFWILVREDAARHGARRIPYVAAGAAVGALLGAILADRVAVLAGAPDMLLCLGIVQWLTAWLLSANGYGGAASMGSVRLLPRTTSSPLRLIADAPPLQRLVVVILLGATAAALVGYVARAEAVAMFGPGDNLLRVFALYHGGVALAGLGLQVASIRATDGIYDAIALPDRRATRTIVEVGVARLGEAVAGGLIRVILLVAPVVQFSVTLSFAVLAMLAAVGAAARLNQLQLQSPARRAAPQEASMV